jgi:hypothetical protein
MPTEGNIIVGDNNIGLYLTVNRKTELHDDREAAKCRSICPFGHLSGKSWPSKPTNVLLKSTLSFFVSLLQRDRRSRASVRRWLYSDDIWPFSMLLTDCCCCKCNRFSSTFDLCGVPVQTTIQVQHYLFRSFSYLWHPSTVNRVCLMPNFKAW